MASLLVISGSTAGDYYLLGNDPVVLGRDEDSPIQIVDEAVSRKHLRISPDGDRSYAAEDLASANGTFINDIRIGEIRPLADGDVLRLGTTELMFSAIDFADGETAFQHYRQHGERDKSTIIRRK
ncbi:MAG: FHA domain-containing protein [Phycisphaerales bacterium]